MTATFLHVTALYGGGVDRHLRDIARSVPGRHLLWQAGASADVLEVPAENRRIVIDRAAPPQAVEAALATQGIGLIHVHSTTAAARALARRLASALEVPMVASLHDVLFLRPDAFDHPADAGPEPSWLAEVSAFLREAAAVVVPSEFIARLARRHIEGLAIDVVPNGSPYSTTPRDIAPRAAFATHRPKHVVAVVGAIGPHKGSELLESLAPLLAGSGIGVVVIGYLDRQLHPGWRVPGALYVHGAFADEDLPALLAAYGAELALFPNRAPESFSYTLSDVWEAGVPVLSAPQGALGERIKAHGGGWLLPEGFTAEQTAGELKRLLGEGAAAELARVKSQLTQPDPGRVPTLDAMARSLDALYRRFAIDPAAPGADAAALEKLATANLDGTLFRQELVRLADEYAQAEEILRATKDEAAAFETRSRDWLAKLERDVAEVQAALAAETEARRSLGEQVEALTPFKAAFEMLPRILQRYLLRKVHARR